MQSSIDVWQETMEEKRIDLKTLKRFGNLKKKWNIGNLKSIETENGSTEQDLQDLEDRPRHGNLRFDGIT